MAAAPKPVASPDLPAGAQENVRFEGGSDPFAGVTFPDKFLKDGKPDLNTFVSSYGELETRFATKTEDLRNTIKAEYEAELAKGKVESPDKYELPTIEGVDPKELGEHDLVTWWRTEAHKSGIGQEGFAAGVAKYIEAITPPPIDMEAVAKDLGENHAQRIAAVNAWAIKTAKNDGEMNALKGLAISADGVKLVERLAGIGGNQLEGGEAAGGSEKLTLDQLKAMQADPRYFDPARRDPEFVKKVDDGYSVLYPPKK